MPKRFFSMLFRRYVEPNNKYYWSIVYAELLYRIDDLERRNCSCMGCKSELNNYKDYFVKLKRENGKGV